MLSFGAFQIYVWIFLIMGWIGTIIISVSSIIEVVKLVKGVRNNA
ncbi:hypothetical protein [Lentibacillus saliphilus]|nr:hypothetical protein [Lentibacillus saliphilus]